MTLLEKLGHGVVGYMTINNDLLSLGIFLFIYRHVLC